MRICRFGDNRLGLVEGTSMRDVTAALDELPAYRYPLPQGDMLARRPASVPASSDARRSLTGPCVPSQ